MLFNGQYLFDESPPLFQESTDTDNATPTDKFVCDVVDRYMTEGYPHEILKVELGSPYSPFQSI